MRLTDKQLKDRMNWHEGKIKQLLKTSTMQIPVTFIPILPMLTEDRKSMRRITSKCLARVSARFGPTIAHNVQRGTE